MKKNGEETEIHSENVKKLLGDMPHPLMIWSIVIIIIVLFGLIAAGCMLPYPYSDGESILTHLLREI